MVRNRTFSMAKHTDAEIATAARQALDLASDAAAGISAGVDHGYVTLTGEAGSAAEAEMAERAVRRLRGVQGVINCILIVHAPEKTK
jgi:osmotically-inducible protein OsmY